VEEGENCFPGVLSSEQAHRVTCSSERVEVGKSEAGADLVSRRTTGSSWGELAKRQIWTLPTLSSPSVCGTLAKGVPQDYARAVAWFRKAAG
jgi:hypothetical protein